jgi:hypothetical protein
METEGDEKRKRITLPHREDKTQ